MGHRLFDEKGWEDLFYWIHEDRKIADRIYKLLNDIERNGASKGIGKPEKLRYRKGWSRRIDEENRLTYVMLMKMMSFTFILAKVIMNKIWKEAS